MYTRTNSTFNTNDKSQYASVRLNTEQNPNSRAVNNYIRNNYLSNSNSQNIVLTNPTRYSVSRVREITKNYKVSNKDAIKNELSSRDYSKRTAYNTNLSMKLASSGGLYTAKEMTQLKSKSGQKRSEKMTNMHHS